MQKLCTMAEAAAANSGGEAFDIVIAFSDGSRIRGPIKNHGSNWVEIFIQLEPWEITVFVETAGAIIAIDESPEGPKCSGPRFDAIKDMLDIPR